MKTLYTVLAAGILMLCSGCTTTVSQQADESRYTLKRTFPYNTWETHVGMPLEKVHQAVVNGFGDLGLEPITNRVDAVSATVDAIFADGKDVEAKLVKVSEELTRITLRAGISGDEERTKMVFRAIEKHF